MSDDGDGVISEFGGRVAVVAFGGLFHRMGNMPPFEFFGTLAGLDVSRVFLRDFDQAWYQRGVRGVGDDYPAVADWLRALLDAHKVERTVCVGSSAGGFAAIMFGCLIGADEIHAFGAETTIDRSQLAGHDARWDETLERIAFDGRPTMLDLAPLVASSGQVHCHWGNAEPEDGWHAHRVQAHVHEYDGLDHANLARVLRDRGELRSILIGAISGRTAVTDPVVEPPSHHETRDPLWSEH